MFAEAVRLQGRRELGRAAKAYRSVPGLEGLLARTLHNGRVLAAPDFLIIGAPRAGTTWLKQALNAVPRVRLPPGEPCYLSARPELPPAQYLGELAAIAGVGRSDGIVGDKSPDYLVMPEDRVALCAALFPKVRLVCILRDPAAQAWSMIHHRREALGLGADWTGEAGETRPPPEEHLAAFRANRETPLKSDALTHCLYETNLGRWARYYPPGQFLLIDFERIGTEPDAVFAEVLDHIGAPPMPLPQRAAAPVGVSTAPPDAMRAKLERLYDGVPFRAVELRKVMEAVHAAAAAEEPDASGAGGVSGSGSSRGLSAEADAAIWSWLIGCQPENLKVRAGQGREHLANGRFAEAEEQFRMLTDARPDESSYWKLLGDALHARGIRSEAEQAWRRALALAPDDPGLHDRLGRLLMEQGRPAEAARPFRAAAELDPGNLKRWRILAGCLMRAGDMGGELAALERALAIDSADTKTLGRLTRLRRELELE